MQRAAVMGQGCRLDDGTRSVIRGLPVRLARQWPAPCEALESRAPANGRMVCATPDASARGAIIAATPFTEDGRLDLAATDRLIEFYLEQGVDGMTILGMMGEAPKLTEEEARTFALHARPGRRSGAGSGRGSRGPWASLRCGRWAAW
ncbi:MAG: dihydrodipicolinate synthase family protein [Geminicoccaceae bacterium]